MCVTVNCIPIKSQTDHKAVVRVLLTLWLFLAYLLHIFLQIVFSVNKSDISNLFKGVFSSTISGHFRYQIKMSTDRICQTKVPQPIGDIRVTTSSSDIHCHVNCLLCLKSCLIPEINKCIFIAVVQKHYEHIVKRFHFMATNPCILISHPLLF